MSGGAAEENGALVRAFLAEEGNRMERRKKRMQLLNRLMAATAEYMTHLTLLIDAEESAKDEEQVDHRTLPRTKRRMFARDRALQCIMDDYLCPTPLFNDRQFEIMFRISRSRFERLRADIAATGHPFYLLTVDVQGNPCVSLEARLLLPLKTIAYGVPPHCFMDYFQMSETLARECCVIFDVLVKSIYEKEYLRHPTSADCKSLSILHENVHCFPGMFGSLDCMHTFWKNCPVGWHGSYRGKEKKPTIVLEAIADYNLWFWHAAYGHPGTLNDLNILALSPFLGMLLDGSFEELERSACPYSIGGESFNEMFFLVDGIYPKYTRFVRGIKEPSNIQEKKFTKWQEGCRKDIERAFGVLQCKFQCMARPFHQILPELIGERVATCLILHNMCVSDRVMDGNVHAMYKPSECIERNINTGEDDPDDIAGQRPQASDVEQPDDLVNMQGGATHRDDMSTIGTNYCSVAEIRAMTRAQRWMGLKNGDEVSRLHSAIKTGVSRLRAAALAARNI